MKEKFIVQVAGSARGAEALTAALDVLLMLASSAPPDAHPEHENTANRPSNIGRGFLVDPVHQEKGTASTTRVIR